MTKEMAMGKATKKAVTKAVVAAKRAPTKNGSGRIDFAALKARAHPVLLQVLEEWFPDGHLEANEFKTSDEEGGAGNSLSFNIDKGIGADFAAAMDGWEGGDIISLNKARLHHALGREASMLEAARDLQQLLDKWGTNPPKPGMAAPHASQYRPIAPVTKEQELTIQGWARMVSIWRKSADLNLTELDARWEYRDEYGALLQYVIRWDTVNRAGERVKNIRAVTLDSDKMDWRLRHLPAPRPLYGLDRLAARPEAPVLLVEGEKTADAAGGLFPDYVVMAWCGGAKSVLKADWTPLGDRNVVLWPDADKAGLDAMVEVGTCLRGISGTVRVVALPGGLDEGWDLADKAPEGMDLRALIDGAGTVTEDRAAPDSPIIILDPNEELEAALERMTKQYFVAQDEKGSTLVYAMKHDPLMKRHRLSPCGFEDLKKLYLNQQYQLDEKRSIGLAAAWLQWRRRPTYNGIIFDPSLAPGPTKHGFFNLWRGFSIAPKPGRWDLFREHVFENLCQANQANYDYFIRWCARMYQEPEKQGETAPAIRGEEGAGKGIIIRTLGEPLGQHFIQISSQDHLVGKFNAHQRDAILMFVDEGYWAGNKQAEGSLKRLITEPTLFIEPKGKDPFPVPNRLHVMIASNNEWIVPAGWGARRFFVLEIGNKRLGDKPFFQRLVKELNDGGTAAFLHDMLEMDISSFRVSDVVQTPWLIQQKKLTMPKHEEWWLRKLESGKLVPGSNGWANGETRVETEALYTDYAEAMRQMREDHPKADNSFGMMLYKMFERWGEKNGHDKWPVKERDRSDEKRYYKFPILADCRRAFNAYTGMDWEWPNDIEAAM